MIRRSAFIALARAASAAFFLATSLYCLLTYNAFAYQQFIRPHMISALTGFTVWHGLLYWVVLLITAVTLFWTSKNPPPRVWMFLAVSAAIGVWLLVEQVLPETENSSRSLYLALAALVPPIWLAVIDHLEIRVEPAEPSDDRRLLYSAVVAALMVWISYALAAPFRPRPSGAMVISWRELVLGASSSAVAHLTIFVLIVLIAITIRELTVARAWPPRVEYLLLAGASGIAVALVFLRFVFAAIAFRGPAAWAVSALLGALVALTWSSIARHRHADAPSPPRTAMDLWLAPIVSSPGRLAPLAGLFLLPAAAYVLTGQAAILDWNFMVQQLIALVVWLISFALVHAVIAAVRSGAHGRVGVAVPLAVLMLYGVESAAMPRLSSWLHDERLLPDFVLDGYAALDPSYKLLHERLTPDPGADPEFYAFLRAHSTIHPTVPIEPADVDFVKPLPPAPGDKPHIFFFLIDSLRPDYVGAYNPAVTFTPRFDAFAQEEATHVFARAFSRYGGTGLSVPSIWSGGMVIHQEYVTPFGPMNTLEKLLVRNGYELHMTKDHITELFTPSPAISWLDEDVKEMDHSLCGTTRELEARLRRRPAGGPPIFAHTRPLDLHVSKIRRGVPPPGESYPGFSEAYAARVRRLDACFGGFLDALKEMGLYDNSIVILTADHGDSLGEEQRWGHAYTLFPEVVRIPLLFRLPRHLNERVAADLGRLTVGTDITPTLYALLGYRLAPRGPLFGVPLFDTPDADWSRRRHESLFLASSYGAVYGLLSHNGRRLYIVDAINDREYLYEITGEPLGRRLGVTAADRARSRKAIRDQVTALAAVYRFTPHP